MFSLVKWFILEVLKNINILFCCFHNLALKIRQMQDASNVRNVKIKQTKENQKKKKKKKPKIMNIYFIWFNRIKQFQTSRYEHMTKR